MPRRRKPYLSKAQIIGYALRSSPRVRTRPKRTPDVRFHRDREGRPIVKKRFDETMLDPAELDRFEREEGELG